MALNLNPPSHFVRSLKQGQNVLLPPSSFKKTSPERQTLQKNQPTSKKTSPESHATEETQTDVKSTDQIPSKEPNRTPIEQSKRSGSAKDTEDPWKSLALASRKLEELKEQNAELKRCRKRNKDQSEDIWSHSDGTSGPPHSEREPISSLPHHQSAALLPPHHRVTANLPPTSLPPNQHIPQTSTQYLTHHGPSVPIATHQHPASGTLYQSQLPGSGTIFRSPQQDHAQLLHLRHTADILTKQATEVAQLQTELDATKLRSTKEIAELKQKLRQVEDAKMEQGAELTARLKSQELMYTKKVEALQELNQEENTNLKGKIQNLEKSMQLSQTTHKADIRELQDQLTNEQAMHRQGVAELKEQLRCKQEEIDSLSKLVTQMRTYFGEKKEAEETALLWQQQKQHLESRIFELNKECESLQSTIQLMNVRLSSTNEMLSIQESEVAKGKLEDVDDSKIAHGLLTRWREKVFSLMVQQKSQDIVLQKDAKDQQNIMTELQNKVTSAHNQCLMLEHAIADKEAQLEMERGKMETLMKELDSVKDANNAMECEMQDNKGTLVALGSYMKGFQNWQESVEEKMRSGISKLGGLEQRLLFATSRLDVLKGLLVRKNALLNVQLAEHDYSGLKPTQSEQGGHQPSQGDQGRHQQSQGNQGRHPPYQPDHGSSQPKTTSYDDDVEKVISLDEETTDSRIRIPYSELVVEYEKVKRERGQLTERIQADATYFEETIQSMRQKLECKITEAEEKCRELENTMDNMKQTIEGQESDLQEKEASLSAATETIDKLKMDVAKLQVGADKASKERCETLEVQYRTQLTEMEQRLNEARREHAKAVVSLRQLERQQSREKDRSTEMLRLQEEQSHLEVTRLANQLKDSERDRNLLMATLRQEGLINQYKAQRNAAKKMPSDSNTVINVPLDKPTHVQTSSTGAKPVIQKDSLITMIADVKALTEEVLQDEDKIDTGDPES